jgi:hypothetical protein
VFDLDAVRKLCVKVTDTLDPDGLLREVDCRHATRELHLQVRPDGSGRLSGEATAELTEHLRVLFDTLAAPRAAVEGAPDARTPGAAAPRRAAGGDAATGAGEAAAGFRGPVRDDLDHHDRRGLRGEHGREPGRPRQHRRAERPGRIPRQRWPVGPHRARHPDPGPGSDPLGRWRRAGGADRVRSGPPHPGPRATPTTHSPAGRASKMVLCCAGTTTASSPEPAGSASCATACRTGSHPPKSTPTAHPSATTPTTLCPSPECESTQQRRRK